MDEQRLAEIEARAECGSFNGDAKEMRSVCVYDVPALVAEVRRLQRALRLDEASRGIPVGVGRD